MSEYDSKKIWHKFLVYLPVILVFSLIIMIFLTFIFTYVLVMINTSPEEDIDSYIFGNTLSPIGAHTKGVVLLIVILTLVLLLITSFFRAVFMDPGTFPSPLELENKIIKTNLPKAQGELKKNEDFDFEFDNDKHSINKDYSIDTKKRIEFLSTFNKLFSNGPLTVTETTEMRNKISAIFPDPKNEKIISSLTIEEVIERNKKEYMDKYELEIKNNTWCYKKNLPSAEALFLTIYSDIDFNKLNLCGNCLRFKVERSHHCRQCGKCILRMDHHCPWLANCIGFRNFKSFCLLHFYGVISTLLITLSYWEVVYNYNMNPDKDLLTIVYVTFVYACNIGLMCFLFWLLIVNIGLVFSGQTIIEQADRERFPSKGINPYDLGWYRNFTNIFGNNPLHWFIPFYANYKGKGYLYETTDFYLD